MELAVNESKPRGRPGEEHQEGGHLQARKRASWPDARLATP